MTDLEGKSGNLTLADFGNSASETESVAEEKANQRRERQKHRRAASPSQSARAVDRLGNPVSDCIVFDVSGDWAHFARPNTTAPILSYGIPPRTTVTGLLAAIQGYKRDSYYQLFNPEYSSVTVSVNNPIRRRTVPMNFLGTEGGKHGADISTIKKENGGERRSQIRSNRQQTSVEYVVNPSYRVYVSVDSPEFMNSLEHRLQESRPYYPPALGKVECLASLDFIGRFKMEPRDGENVTIDSVVPGENPALVVEPERNYISDRFPMYFDVNDNHDRYPKRWHDLTFDASGNPITVREAEYTRVGSDNVMFG